MKPYRYLIPLFSLLAVLVLTPTRTHATPYALRNTQHATRTTFTPTPCPFPVTEPERVECGTLTVPADHAQPDGPTLQLAVSILRSRHEDAAAEPVLYLAGGPGDAAAYLAGAPLLPLVAEGRWDFIFFDQRGTGFSQPNLTCPGIEIQPDWPTLLTEHRDISTALHALDTQVSQQCYEVLVQQGIDPSLFTTAQIAQDVVVLRQALGVEQWYLLGFSYGTYLAQEVLRYDAAAIRGLLLDSPVPQTSNLYANTPLMAAAAYDHLFTSCTANLACRIAYPDLEARFLALVARLNEQPLPLTLATAGELPLTGDQLVAFLPSLMGTPNTFGLIPSLIADLEQGKTEQLASLVAVRLAEPVRPQHGLGYAVICHDLFHPLTDAEYAAATADIPALYTRSFTQEMDALSELCAFWPQGDAAASRPPLPTDIPALILAGELDVSTPPLWGEQLQEQFHPSTYALIPNVGHVVLQGGDCPNSIMLSFLLDPANPSTTCVGAMRSPVFLIDEDISRPWAKVGMVLLAAGLVITAGRSGYTLFRSQPAGQVWRQFTWRASRRALGWWPTVLSGLVLTLTFVNYNRGTAPGNEMDAAFHTSAIVATFIPLMAGLQAALLLAPDDEPALEVQLATPRPLLWTILERLVWVVLLQGGIGLVGMFIARSLTGTEDALWISLVQWAAPMVALMGIGLFITLMSRQPAFGVAMTGVVWFALLIFGRGLVLRWPFLWPIHFYLTPDTLSLADYGLNRLAVTLIGLGFMWMALRQVQDEERVLLGTARRGKARAGSVAVAQEGGWSAAAVNPSSLHRFLAHVLIIIRNEFRLQWRRRATLVVILSTTVFPIFTALIIRNGSEDLIDVMVAGGVFTVSEAQLRLALSVVSFSFAPLYTVLLLLVPPVVADIIPKDRQSGISELFASTPLSQAAYLLGKLLGMWLSLLYGMGLNLLVTFIAWRVLLGIVVLGPMLEVWFFAAGTVLLLNGGLAVLLAAPLPHRRLAILIGVGVAIVSLVNLGTNLPHNLAFYFNLSRPAYLDYYAFRGLTETGVLPIDVQVTGRDIWLTLLAGLGQLLVVGLAVWRWLERKNG